MARLISAEEALFALIESLVNPVLAKVRPFGGVKAAERDVSNQMEAVAWLYNYYVCQELPNLVPLDWEDICSKASVRQTKLLKFMGTLQITVSHLLTLTEQKVKKACEAAKALRASSNIRGGSLVTKVCVCLLNFRQDKCVLVLGATTVGVWSFIEKDRHFECTKDDADGTVLSDEELAFQAVEEHTGIKANVLQVESSFLINDDLSEGGGSTKFFIMLCSGTFDLSPVLKLERIAWVLLDNFVLSKARGPLIDTLDQPVQSTPAVHYFHLRPFYASLESWLTRQKDVKSLDQPKHGPEKNALMSRYHEVKEVGQLQHVVEHGLKDRAETLLEDNRRVTEEKSCQKQGEDQQRQLPNANIEAVGLNIHHPCKPSGSSPQSSTGLKAKADLLILSTGRTEEHSPFVQKQEDDRQRQANLKVIPIVMETKLQTGSPLGATLLGNKSEPSALRNGGSANDMAAFSNKQIEGNARQANETLNPVALSLNMPAPNGSPQSSTRINKKEEEHILDKARAVLSLKTAFRSVRKRRKALSKELREHTLRIDELYKQIAQYDTDLVTLMGGGKAGLQLAIEVCKKDCEKHTSSSDISIDRSQTDTPERTCQEETSNKKRSFQMLKSSIQELDEVCTKNDWPLPSYGVLMCKDSQGDNAYSGKVRIRTKDFELSESGEASDTAKRARLSAAAFMLSTLHLLRARNSFL